MLAEQRRERFTQDVAARRTTDQATGGARARAAGLALMIVGVVAAFVTYHVSLGQNDLRDIASLQLLATAFLAVTVLGGVLHLAGTVQRLLRLWLLRRMDESRAHAERIVTALGERAL